MENSDTFRTLASICTTLSDNNMWQQVDRPLYKLALDGLWWMLALSRERIVRRIQGPRIQEATTSFSLRVGTVTICRESSVRNPAECCTLARTVWSRNMGDHVRQMCNSAYTSL